MTKVFSTRFRWQFVVVVVTCVIAAAALGGDGQWQTHTEKLAETPAFYQCDSRGQFPKDGRNYCCPTAVSDSFVYLSAHGYPRLLDGDVSQPFYGQIAMIKQLASPACMNTDPDKGSDQVQALAGIKAYVESHGYTCRRLEYRGWRAVPAKMSRYVTGGYPSAQWIEEAVADGRGAAWVNLGWYVRGAKQGEWKRVSGHWVAVVGFGTDGQGHEDQNILLVDNPAVRAAAMEKADKPNEPTARDIAASLMTLSVVGSGRLVGNQKGLPRAAAGMYQATGAGVAIPRKYDAAFVDGAIVMEMEEVR